MKLSTIQEVDLAIIGGGINGAGLAAQAAQAGLSVVLLEKGDFASGTSSKSTKLIHGGIRYLEQARFGLVFEALQERHHLLGMAPHLVHPMPFLLPSYQGDQRPSWMLKVGLWFYDLLAGTQNIARHQWFTKTEALEKAQGLNPEGLIGCGLYYDAQVNDARLVLENILAAKKAGAGCFNYCEVSQLALEENGVRLFYHDHRSREEGVVKARCLVNASGPWANQTAKLLSENTMNLVRPTRGTHIVVPQVLSEYAVLVTTQRDNRVIFIIPWRGVSLIGTTDLDDPESPEKVRPSEQEIQYLLEEASRVFPHLNWKRSQVLSAFSGLRPLAWTDGGQASSVSREDKILRNGQVLTIVGGKLTTYHAMAEKALEQTMKVLLKKRPTQTRRPLPGAPALAWDRFLKEEVSQWAKRYEIEESQAQHLARLYGQRSSGVLELLEDSRLREKLHPDRPEMLAQVKFALDHEKALHLEDVLSRRLEIGYSAQRWGPASEKASRLMAELLHWNENTRQKELNDYKKTLFPQP